jgi:hypothetical protein
MFKFEDRCQMSFRNMKGVELFQCRDSSAFSSEVSVRGCDGFRADDSTVLISGKCENSQFHGCIVTVNCDARLENVTFENCVMTFQSWVAMDGCTLEGCSNPI